MTYRAVIFDLFGTLVDNFDVHAYSTMLGDLADILGVEGPLFRDLWRDSFDARSTGLHADTRDTFRAITAQAGVTVTDAQVDKAFTTRLAFSEQTLKPRPGTVPTLQAVRASGRKTGLVSDCTGEVPVLWAKTEFHGLFDTTIFSCSVGIKKPDPRIYRLAIEQLGVAPGECLYVGDGSSNELTGASALGMRAILIRDPGEVWDELFNTREDNWTGERISYLSEILPMLS